MCSLGQIRSLGLTNSLGLLPLQTLRWRSSVDGLNPSATLEYVRWDLPHPPPYILYRLGWRRVGNDTEKHAAYYLSCCRHGTDFFFWRSVTASGRVRSSFVRGGEPLLCTRGMIGSRRVYGKASKRQLYAVSWKWPHRKLI